MPPSTPPSTPPATRPSAALAGVLVDELVRGGVQHVVLSPGSRSAPLAYALAEADAAGRLVLHVRIDERSAGFLALGLARASGRPVPVVTTSGTAVANLHPAVLEAHHAGVGLVVLSADRPAELRGTGANQTTRQPGLFADALRWEADLPAPQQVSPEANAHWRSTVCRALAAAGGRPGGWPGPVHLNVSFRDPLAPALDDDPGALPLPEGRPDGGPWTEVVSPGHAPAPGASAGLEPGPRTLVLLGDLPDPALTERALDLAHEAGWPVLAEPFGVLPVGPTVVPHGVLVAGRLAAGIAGDTDTDADAAVDHLWPERVVVIGRLTLFRELGALTRRRGMRVEHVSATPTWTDPGHVVHRVHPVSVLDHAPAPTEGSGAWLQTWLTAGRALTGTVAAVTGLDDPTGTPSGPGVAATVVAGLKDGDTLVLGSSSAPRDLALALDHAAGDRHRVVSARGLAGIDGTVSLAVGAALSLGPTVALLGDLTFLHDSNGLLVGPGEPRPELTLVVVNDDGGGIFSTLEYGDPARNADPRAAATTERLFGTPHGTDLAALCAAHHVPHQRVGSLAELARLLADRADAAAGGRRAGLRVIEVPVDRSAHRALRDALR